LVYIWYSLGPFGVFDGHLKHFLVIWYIYVFFPFWYVRSKKNLATLPATLLHTTRPTSLKWGLAYVCSGIPCGHRVRQQSRRSRVRIPPGRKVFIHRSPAVKT
jgi:hypothetical protein